MKEAASWGGLEGEAGCGTVYETRSLASRLSNEGINPETARR
jgi:hypothetical protein